MERTGSQKSTASSTARVAITTRPVPPQASSNAHRVRTASPVPPPSMATVVASNKTLSETEQLHREQREAVEHLETVADNLTRTQEAISTQHDEWAKTLTSLAEHLSRAADDREAAALRKCDELSQRVAELEGALSDSQSRLDSAEDERQEMIRVSERASESIRQLQLENAQLVEEHNLAGMAKDAELEALRQACSQRDDVISALKSTIDVLKEQVNELEQASTLASSERARRSAQLQEARAEADEAVAELSRRMQDTEDDIVNLADALQSRAARFSGRLAGGDLSPSSRPGTLRIRAVSDAVFQKLDALRAERDEYRTQLENSQAQWASERAQLLSAKADVLHALDGQERELSVLRQGAANVPQATNKSATKPIMSLREARAQHKLTTVSFAAPSGESPLSAVNTASSNGVLFELDDLSSILRQRQGVAR